MGPCFFTSTLLKRLQKKELNQEKTKAEVFFVQLSWLTEDLTKILSSSMTRYFFSLAHVSKVKSQEELLTRKVNLGKSPSVAKLRQSPSFPYHYQNNSTNDEKYLMQPL